MHQHWHARAFCKQAPESIACDAWPKDEAALHRHCQLQCLVYGGVQVLLWGRQCTWCPAWPLLTHGCMHISPSMAHALLYVVRTAAGQAVMPWYRLLNGYPACADFIQFYWRALPGQLGRSKVDGGLMDSGAALQCLFGVLVKGTFQPPACSARPD